AFFSPHGGARDADGRSNLALEPPATLRDSLRWVHNGGGPSFDREYSDGALAGGRRHPDELDLARFVSTWQPGGRYRVLVHPQYFSRTPRRASSLAGAPWYEACLDAYAQPPSERRRGAWAGIDLRKNSRVFALSERARMPLLRRQRREDRT